MKIDRSDYEIWIIDWLDGNLSPGQEEQLMTFLGNNPDIREESEELMSAKLTPGQVTYKNRNLLRKDESDIPVQQFEYLCAAGFEGDLSNDQMGELERMTLDDPDKKRTYDLIRKTRLTPPEIRYRHKRSLMRLTPFGRFAKTSAVVLSTAAAAALLISLYFIIPRNTGAGKTGTVVSILQTGTGTTFTVAKGVPVRVPGHSAGLVRPAGQGKIQVIKPGALAYAEKDTITFRGASAEAGVTKVSFTADINLAIHSVQGSLAACNENPVMPEEDDGRSTLGKFIARTFREKILREKTISDAPLKPYEIAEAGVTGLNKLLGWEMALNENKDVNGDIKSVNFSSRMLKFNAPVKKSSPLP